MAAIENPLVMLLAPVRVESSGSRDLADRWKLGVRHRRVPTTPYLTV